MAFYTISSSFNSLERFNTQLTDMNLSTELNKGSNTTQGQDGSQRCTKGYANGDLMHQENKWKFLRQEQVGKQINAGVLLFINEVGLSIYRCLTSGDKKIKE